MPYLKDIPTLWLYSMSSIKANSFSLLDKSYKKTTKYFQSILKTDSKLSAFFTDFDCFYFPLNPLLLTEFTTKEFLLTYILFIIFTF